MKDVLLRVDSAALQVARTLNPQSGMVDSIGNDQDDYRTMLCMHGWSNLLQYREREGESPGEKLYAFKTMWNRAIDYQRQRTRFSKRVLLVDGVDEIESGTDTEAEFDARRTLGVLKATLAPDEWETLAAVGQAGGNIAEAYRDAQPDIALDGWRKRVRRLRIRAQEIVTAQS